MYIFDDLGLRRDLAIARSWNSKRWTAKTLLWKRFTWWFRGKRKGHQWLLPGPTANNAPWGGFTPHLRGEEIPNLIDEEDK